MSDNPGKLLAPSSPLPTSTPTMSKEDLNTIKRKRIAHPGYLNMSITFVRVAVLPLLYLIMAISRSLFASNPRDSTHAFCADLISRTRRL